MNRWLEGIILFLMEFECSIIPYSLCVFLFPVSSQDKFCRSKTLFDRFEKHLCFRMRVCKILDHCLFVHCSYVHITFWCEYLIDIHSFIFPFYLDTIENHTGSSLALSQSFIGRLCDTKIGSIILIDWLQSCRQIHSIAHRCIAQTIFRSDIPDNCWTI